MPDDFSNPGVDAERVVRLERSVRWLKIGLVVVIMALVLVTLFVPQLAAAIGLLLIVIATAGGLVVLIASIIYLLDRLFPGAGPKA